MKNPQSQIIVILPLGAHEQHGPHLPLDTDAIIAQEFGKKLDQLSQHETLLLATETVGYSIEHLDFDGSQSLNYSDAIDRWLSIIKTQYDLGYRKLLLLNAHGGNSPLLTIVATEARVRWNMLVVVTHWTRFGLPEQLVSHIDRSIDIHAGEIETSMMLAIAPDKVQLDQAKDFPSKQKDYTERYKHLRAYGPHAFGWKMGDLNKDGVVGNAQNANVATGQMIIDHTLKGLVELVDDMHKFDQTSLI
jgi:creatinine amidohydrolase